MVITSKFYGHCRMCGAPHEAGDAVDWTAGEKGVKCLACGPSQSSVKQLGMKGEKDVVFLRCLSTLEEAFLISAEKNATPEHSTAWERYGKLKALAIAPGTTPEGRVAFKQALLTLAKVAL